MKKNYKKVVLTAVILIFAFMSFLAANRYYYGSFNIFSRPIRVVYGGFHYNHRSAGTMTLKDKPDLKVSRIIDKITGKRFFSASEDFIGPGKTIYMQIDGDRYISYSSGGGG